jgi:SAM-dependent methyltransferase
MSRDWPRSGAEVALVTSTHSLPRGTDAMAAFVEWIAGDCRSDMVVLDIGAGYDRNHVDAALKPLVGRLVGIDPADTILQNRSLDERHRLTLEEFARTEERRFDLILASWVLEHLVDPHAFFLTCRRLLKSGGAFYAITPNLWHYFGLTTKTTAAVGLEDWALGRLMGAQRKAEYHYPTRYRSNSVPALKQVLEQSGFRSAEFRCSDNPDDYDYVVPPALRFAPRLYSRLVYRLRLPVLMGRLIIRAR